MSAQPADATTKRDWSWLPAHMPSVSALIAERRRKHGAAWVAECWRRGVIQGEPGHFWACEGSLCVGTPPPGWIDPPGRDQMSGQQMWEYTQRKLPGGCLLVMPEPVAAAAGAAS